MGDLDLRGVALIGLVIVFLILLIRWGDFGSQNVLVLPVTMEADLLTQDKTVVVPKPLTTAEQNKECFGSHYEFRQEEKARKVSDKNRNTRRYQHTEHATGCRCEGSTCKVRKVLEHLNDIQPKSFMQMTEGEKVQWIIDTYFKQDDGQDSNTARIQKENDFIKSLPADGSCPDLYSGCARWAANNECTINPEWMLRNCPGSCQSCALTAEQRARLIRIYNSRPPVNCVYHGAPYPGEDAHLHKLLTYGTRSAF
jgi:hypothetical protein